MRSQRFVLCLALTGATGSMACRRVSDPAPVVETEQARPVASVEPTEERLLERVNERWARIVAKDWVAAYEYLTAEQREELFLDRYLLNKLNHVYSHPRVDAVLATAGEDAYTRVFVTWRPLGRCTLGRRLDRSVLDDDSDSQEIELCEQWRREHGDWFFVRAQRPEDYLAEHPDLRPPR